MFRLDLQLFLTGLTHPMMLALNEGVVVNAFAVVVGAEIAFHTAHFTALERPAVRV